jgi:hypothetical protein
MKRALSSTIANGVGSPIQLGYAGSTRMLSRWWPMTSAPALQFPLDDQDVDLIYSKHNCYFPPFRMTERGLELALAKRFLAQVQGEDVLEIGAVTPYYWPGQISRILDPHDKHPLVNLKMEWQDYDGDSRTVLSISTFEHIGASDYASTESNLAFRDAVEKLLRESRRFLVTYPAGYHPAFDTHIKSIDCKSHGIELSAWARGRRGNVWVQRPFAELTDREYTYGPAWANTVIAMTR